MKTMRWALGVTCALLLACDSGLPIPRLIDGVMVNPPQPDVFFGMEEAWRVGSIEGGPMAFGRIAHVDVSAQGEVLVTDGQAGTVRLFDGDGQPLRDFGRRGQGPGEFQQVVRAEFAGDSVVAWAAAGGRLELYFFNREAEFLGSWPLQVETRSIRPVRTAEGWIAVVAGGVDPSDVVPNSTVEMPYSAYELEEDGALGASLGVFPGMVLHLGPNREGTTGPVLDPVPFLEGTTVGEFIQGTGEQYEFRVFDRRGTERLAVRREVEATPVTDGHRDQFELRVREFFASQANVPNAEEQIERILQRSPTGQFLPFIESVAGARDGGYWIRRGDRGSPVDLAMRRVFGRRERVEVQWDYFSAEGAYEGSALFDGSFEPTVWLSDGVVGVQKDELDVDYAVMYRLSPASEEGS